jgi:hypothetical protein
MAPQTKTSRRIVQERVKSVKRARAPVQDIFHPGRRDHALQFIAALDDEKSRKYATLMLDHIWWNKGGAPSKPRGLKIGRVAEINAALYGIFATIR